MDSLNKNKRIYFRKNRGGSIRLRLYIESLFKLRLQSLEVESTVLGVKERIPRINIDRYKFMGLQRDVSSFFISSYCVTLYDIASILLFLEYIQL